MSSRTAHISRADLLRLIDGAMADERQALATLVGFERRESTPKHAAAVNLGMRVEEQPFVPPPEPQAGARSAIKVPVFWRVIAQKVLPEPEVDDDSVPAWWRNLNQAKTIAASATIKDRQGEISLLHWPRLLGFLRTYLITEQPSQLLDERRFVRQIAEARFVKRIPRKAYRRWPQQLVVVIDRSDALYPLWKDYALMCKRLTDLFGARIKLINVAARRDPELTDFQSLLTDAQLSPEAAVSARWLVLTDAGASEAITKRAGYWQALFRWLNDLGLQRPPLALVNAPSSRWWNGLGELAQAAFWDIDQPLRVSRGTGYRQCQAEPDLTKLLAMLSMTPEARPRLLRELRRLLPPDNQDVSWEIAAWNHRDVRYCLPDCYVQSRKRPKHQDTFLSYYDNTKYDHEWPRRAQKVIERHLCGTRAFIRDQAKAWEQAANKTNDDVAGYLVEAIQKLRDLPVGSEREQLVRWVDQVEATTAGQLIAANDKLAAIRYMADRERRLRGQATRDLDSRFDFIFAQKPEREWLLWQQGMGWGVKDEGDSGLPVGGSPIGALRSRNRVFEMRPEEGSGDAAGFWVSGVAPNWASDWGKDEYGLWAEFSIENKDGEAVTQRLRWIEPGQFSMGSPPEEAERLDNEAQHQIVLTEGFWLADTVCTQALWQAVMGENPSEFNGTERPVEQVSWDDTLGFIQTLNAQGPGLQLRLPSEAEWEYGCRAGTDSPFWFGDTIRTDQVNFDGNYPYAGGEKGEFRGETVEVKALPCDGWGLYQMHGNVWEWCNDWYGEYPEVPVTDPLGPEAGEGRVLRGGSWSYYGRSARSARRFIDAPVERNDFAGFRLARGQSGAEPAGPRAARSAERRAEAGRPRGAAVPQLGYGVAEPPPAAARQRIVVVSDRERLTLEAIAKPDWAEAIGRDCFGLFADFRVQGVNQRMRWINPGRFFMGSPEDEAEREDDENRHEVILSQGYWLADTACTQALWEAVIGKNPSNFKGPECPVEQVSWDDTLGFIQTLNAQGPGLQLRLPSEAEWEYACRAGTATPFWFGDSISTDQVNFDGNRPYAGGEKGEYREETIEVKGLPCNGWGLYQMHGNVWEWCNDWYGEYPEVPVTDPLGPEAGERRVLRGGGWNDFGGDARSARRGSFTPVERYSLTGFRLARGQSSSQASSQPTARGAGQAARSDDGQAPRDLLSRLKRKFKIK